MTCGDSGYYTVEGCARYDLPSETWQLISASHDAEAGYLPVAGGTLDQTQKFLAAWRFVRNENARWRNKLGMDK